MSADNESLGQRIELVQQRLAEAARRSGRNATEVILVAVTKMVRPERVVAAFRMGLRDFGENRVQEAMVKIPAVNNLSASDARWHMVGHLQSNKVRPALDHFELLHSIDSLHLARTVSRGAAERSRIVRVLLEVNVAREATKFGFLPEELERAAAEATALPNLGVEGLMTIAPQSPDPEIVRPFFRALRLQRDALRGTFRNTDWRHLSMGMSDDFEVAIEEGATIVRVGRAIFGERNWKT